jgi:uncharacterized membrane protein YozB (DUF420 family)
LDTRLLYWSLATGTAGIAIFYGLMQLVQTSVQTLAQFAIVAIAVFAVFSAATVLLMIAGVIRRRSITYHQTAVLGVSSFVLGIFSLFLTWGSYFEYEDAGAACGGFPPGYWTGMNAIVNRCSIWVNLHQDWAAYLYGLVLLGSAVIFWACVITRLQIVERESSAN